MRDLYQGGCAHPVNVVHCFCLLKNGFPIVLMNRLLNWGVVNFEVVTSILVPK